jgi:hypothetical protein
VFVVHGVATHDEQQFVDRVDILQEEVGTCWKLIPVFWGDLGASAEYLPDTLPEVVPLMRTRTRALGAEDVVITAAYAALGARGVPAVTVRGEQDELSEAIRQELPATKTLQYANDDALRVAGEIIGASVRADLTPASEQTRGGIKEFAAGVRERARETIRELDRFSGALLAGSVGFGVQSVRETYGKPVIDFLGDVIVYQRNQSAIHARIFDAVRQSPDYGKERPVNVLAHSLGGVVVVDAATRAHHPLWIDGLVTFGSQSSFFQTIDPRPVPLTPYSRTHSVVLPTTIRRWTNLWEPLDPFAFIAGKVFRLASGVPPTDIEVTHLTSYGLNTHGSYWVTPELKDAFSQTFA